MTIFSNIVFICFFILSRRYLFLTPIRKVKLARNVLAPVEFPKNRSWKSNLKFLLSVLSGRCVEDQRITETSYDELAGILTTYAMFQTDG